MRLSHFLSGMMSNRLCSRGSMCGSQKGAAVFKTRKISVVCSLFFSAAWNVPAQDLRDLPASLSL